MKKIFTLLFLISIMQVNGQTMFRKTYGFGAVNEAKCAIQTFDNGYAIAGSTTPGWGGQTNFYLIKTDSAGNAEFHFSYGSMGIDKANAILQLPDSGFLLAGYSNGYSPNNDYDAIVIRTDKNGTEQSIHTYGTSGWDFIDDMQLTSDGNYILAGSTFGSVNGSSAGFVIKIDLNGNVLWQKIISASEDITLKKILCKPDGSLTVCGKSENLPTYTSDAFVMFMNSNGDSLRSVIFDNGGKECFNAIGDFSNGDIALSGIIELSGNSDEMIMRMDTAGIVIWSDTIMRSGQDVFYDLHIMNDTLVTVGSTSTSGQGNEDFHIALFSEFGGYINANTYGGSEREFAYSLIVANDGGYVLAGTSNTYGPGQQSVFFVKSDKIFTVDPNVSINVGEIDYSKMNIYPNPSNGLFRILSSSDFNEAVLTLSDVNGNQLFKKTSALPATIEIEEAGIYFLRVSNDSFSEFRKIIVIH